MRKSTIVLLIALAASVGSACWLWGRLARERDEAAALQTRLTALERVSETAAEIAPAVAPARQEEHPAARSTKVVAELPPTSSPATTHSDYMGRQRQLMKNPEYRKALRDQQRQYIEFSFRDLPAVLNLTPEKAAALFDLMAEQSVDSMELQWQQSASKSDGRALQRAAEGQRRKYDAETERLLGSSNMIRLQEFRETLGSRTEVNVLRNELSGGAEALREDQYGPMLDIVFAEEQRMNRELQDLYASNPLAGGRSHDSVRTDLAVAANRRIVESARSILTQSQLAAVENLYRRQQIQMESQNTMTRLQVEAAARNTRDPGGN
jgi:hypothetical protein